MKKIFFCLIPLLILVCCNNQKIPDNVLPPQKMQSVLWDMLQAEELANFQLPKDSTLSILDRHTMYYQKVFQVQNITKEQFKRSLGYYQTRPDLLKVMFDSLQYRVDSLEVKKPEKKDSLKAKRHV
jgi:hypothetical protein